MPAKPSKENGIPEGFWELVRAAMAGIYVMDSRRASRLRKDIGALDAKRRAIFYHTDPLSVAANLSGRAISDEDAEAYRRLPEWRVYAGLGKGPATEVVLTKGEVRVPRSERSMTKAELTKSVAKETRYSEGQVREVLKATFLKIDLLAESETRPRQGRRGGGRAVAARTAGTGRA